jgi:hypothetical protein
MAIKRKLIFGRYLGSMKIKISQRKKIISEIAKKYKLFGPTNGKKNLELKIKGVNKIKYEKKRIMLIKISLSLTFAIP